jgi:hypothetical protein
MKYEIALAVVMGVVLGAYYGAFPSGFDSLTSKEKLEFLYSKVLADKGVSAEIVSTLTTLAMVNPVTWLGGQDFNQVGHLVSDQYPSGKHKGIHGVGVAGAAKFVWIPEAVKKYTGSFKKADHVFFRMSAAAVPAGGINTPSISIKVLRDNAPSGSFMLMYDLHGQKEDNIFTHPMSNHLDKPPAAELNTGESLLFKKFASYDAHPGMIGLADVAGFSQDGKKVENPAAPLALFFQPNPEVTKKCEGQKINGVIYGCVESLPVGTELFKVYAVDQPWTPATLKSGGKDALKAIGWFVLTGQMKKSKFADSQVLFKHVFWADDLKQQPGHPASWNGLSPDGEYAYAAGIKKFGPYAPVYTNQPKRRNLKVVKAIHAQKPQH